MLRGLLEREHWAGAPVIAALVAAPWALVCVLAPGAAPGVFAFVCLVLLLSGRFSARATVFEAALPIPGRQLVAARVLTVLAFLWLPVLVMIAEALLFQGWKAALPVLETAAVATLVALVAQSSRLRQPSPSAGLPFLVLLCAGAVVVNPSLFSHTTAVLGGLLAVSALLAARLWLCAPDGFQIAPARAARPRLFARFEQSAESALAAQTAKTAQAAASERRWRISWWRWLAPGAAGGSMLGVLLDREPGWEFAPFAPVLAAVVWPIVCMLAPDLAWALFGVFCGNVGAGSGRQRATAFEAALPIPGRQLVAARLLTTFALLWPATLVTIGESLALKRPNDAPLLLAFAAVMSLMVLLEQSFRVREASTPKWYGLVMFCLVFAPLFLFPPPDRHWGALLIVCLAASAALLVSLWFRVPDSFQIAPARPMRASRFALPCPHWQRTWRPAWRSFANVRVWSTLFLAWLAAKLGMSLVLGAGLVPLALSTCRRVEWLLVLPVSRRRLLFMTLLPVLCILIVAISVTGHFRAAANRPAVSTGYGDIWQEKPLAGSGTPNVLAPSAFWHWTWGWGTPVIQSPWGEKTEPKTFLRLGFATYNPYSVAPDNSERFLDWQFARAAEAVYGRAIPRSQTAGFEKPGPVAISRRLRTRSIEVLAAILIFLAMFNLSLWGKARGHNGWVVLGWFVILTPFGLDLFTAGQVVKSGMLSEVVTLRLAAILPQNWAALAVVAALPLGGLYWALEKQFEKVDLVPGVKPAGQP
jgi:hypothetical protein